MGVPALFRTVVSEFGSVLESHIPQNIEIDLLCFDFNCLIHFCKQKAPVDCNNVRNQEEILIVEVVRYTVYICNLVQPKQMYISMDGCVPYAKMKQQRARRFMKKSEGFDSNKISPGTAFMSKLSARIKNVMAIGWMTRKTKCYFSDVNVPGEGEAKIMKYLQQQKEANVVIYGLDADLIILSTLQHHKIRLMRESDQEHEFDYLNINNLKKSILNTYVIPVSKEPEDFFKDFAALSCLGGNDFVEALPHCKIRDKGFEKLMNAYLKVNQPLVMEGKLNLQTLEKIVSELETQEEESLNKTYTRIYYNKDHLEEGQYEHAYYTNPNHPDYKENKKIFQTIQFTKPYTWWNETFFPPESLSSVCYEYIRSIQWCIHYYFHAEPPSWEYVYPYENAPLCKDLVKYIPEQLPEVSDQTKPFYPLEQLFYIMPPTSIGLFPKNYAIFINDTNSPLNSYFPRKVQLNVLKGLKQIYTEPKFDKNLLEQKEYIRTILHKVPISQYEANRNMVRSEPFFKFT